MKDILVLLGAGIFFYFIAAQVGCLLSDIYDDNDLDDWNEGNEE